jgi:bifunctional DNA-binding transcriptional regulator/antitoxin component of YhaV-PrlF toxin-antitoxin module
MRLNTKGQVTIPPDIREQTVLLPDVEVEFEVTPDGVLIRKKRGAKTERWSGRHQRPRP